MPQALTRAASFASGLRIENAIGFIGFRVGAVWSKAPFVALQILRPQQKSHSAASPSVQQRLNIQDILLFEKKRTLRNPSEILPSKLPGPSLHPQIRVHGPKQWVFRLSWSLMEGR